MSLISKIRKIRKMQYQSAKTLGDVQAVLQGRIGHRLVQRQVGKMSRKSMNKVLPKRKLK